MDHHSKHSPNRSLRIYLA